VLLAMAVPMGIFASPLYLDLLVMIWFNIGIVISLWILLRTGETSCGHAAFVAIGAYTCAITTTQLGFSVWIAFLLGGIVAMLIALMIGQAVLHTKGIYFLVVTLGFGEVLRAIWLKMDVPFGSAAGIKNIPAPEGFPLIIDTFHSFYFLMMIFSLIVILSGYALSRSRFGLLSTALVANEKLVAACGTNIKLCKTKAFVIGCFFAGLGGAIYASYLGFISPFTFTARESLYYVMYAVVGGPSVFAGPVVGAVICTTIYLLLYAVGYYRIMVFGVLLLIVMLVLPGGLVSLPQRLSGLAAKFKFSRGTPDHA